MRKSEEIDSWASNLIRRFFYVLKFEIDLSYNLSLYFGTTVLLNSSLRDSSVFSIMSSIPLLTK